MQLETEKTQSEELRDTASVIKSIMAATATETERKILTKFQSAFEELKKVDPQARPNANSGDRASLSPRPNSNYSALYRQLDPAMRELRSPDFDHWAKQWFVAKYRGDHAGLIEASVKLNEGWGQRADILEGAADSGGGIGAGTGADLLPHPLGQVIMTARDKVNKIRRFALPAQMTSQTLQIPTFGAVTSYMVTEGATATQGEPDPGSVMFRANKMQAYAIASNEFVDDTAFNVVTLLANRAGSSLGALEDVQAGTSNGSAPNISAALTGGNVAETTSTQLGFVDLRLLYFAVPQEYRDGAIWLGDANMMSGISSFVDSTGKPILQAFIDPPAPVTDDPGAIGTIFGKRVYEFPLAAGILFFGNVGAGYVWASRAGITAEVSRDVLFASDRTAWKFTQRIDGNVVDQAGMKQAAGITSWNATS